MTNLLHYTINVRKPHEQQQAIFAHKLQSAPRLRLIKPHNWHKLRRPTITAYPSFILALYTFRPAYSLDYKHDTCDRQVAAEARRQFTENETVLELSF